MTNTAVELAGIHKTFGQHAAVSGMELKVAKGEFLTLLGPSGCGKTTTLNMIAGFIRPDSGEIRLAGRSVIDEPPYRRDIGLVFQDYALFPHMSVEDNIGFGLRMRKVPKAEITTRVGEALELVHLDGLGARMPLQLSGGQRQRVALARALVIRPTVLLLDEPLSNLDLKLREEMRLEITRVQRLVGITTILVTHDQGEALAVSDRIAVMRGGKIDQLGTPVEVYEAPTSRFVSEFIGTMNVFACRPLETATEGAVCRLSYSGGTISAVAPKGAVTGHDAVVMVRPEHLAPLDASQPGDGDLIVEGEVLQHVYLGEVTQVIVRGSGGETCMIPLPRARAEGLFPVGARARLSAQAEHCRIFGAS